MAAMAGIWNNTAAAASSPILAKPQSGTSGSGGTGTSSTDSATISANDYLTLLVTELQHQDPTASTNPNEYVNQLVSVNSLEQLIKINQTLGSALGTPTGHSVPATGAGLQTLAADAGSTAAPTTPGNLAIPAANPSAQRVAQALSGSSH